VILFFAGLGMLVAAAVAAIVVRGDALRDRVFATLVVAGAGLVSVPAFRVLGGAANLVTRSSSGLPGGDWVIGIDPLSAVFLLVVMVVGAANAVYGAAYMRADGDTRVSRQANATYAVLVVVLALVVTAQSVVLFLCAWEMMAISSFLLVMTNHQETQVRRAGFIYIVATHTGTLLLFVMFAIWSNGAADWTFASLAANRSTLMWGGGPLFLMALVGFGMKAGFVPLHFWLPPAHASSPSHVSAVMSGILIKMGVYGMLRVVMLAGPPPVWWAWTVLSLGALSAVLGVLWALAQHDIKRLLAYHSVENIGIIMIGMGLGALGTVYGHPMLAILGYGAAVLHTVNHALFKALLFMSAGAVYRMTGTRNIEELGGLARRMPVTFAAFLIGSVAIIGVPPLNGFVSEWLVYQGLFRAAYASDALRIALLAAPVLALVGGLALACFAKATGVMFLGNPRSDKPLAAREVGAAMLVPQLALAAICAVIGLLPSIIVRPFLFIGATIAGEPDRQAIAAWADVSPAAQNVALFAVGLLSVAALIWVGRRFVLGRRSVSTDSTWGCGYGATTSRMQYTASSFAAPLLAVFGPLTGVQEHRGATVFHSSPRDLVLDRVVTPLWARVQRSALRLRPIQDGRLHFYLLYVVASVVICLAYLVIAP
jgi:formate hydrogenlyase subunit 3/multisubunit Na+/H+ antiporter MnhD subunit